MHDDVWLALIKERHTFSDQPVSLGEAIIALVVILGLIWLWADAVIFIRHCEEGGPCEPSFSPWRC